MIFRSPFFLLLNSGLLHDHPLDPRTQHCARTKRDSGLKESSAGLARNLPRQGSYMGFALFCRLSLSTWSLSSAVHSTMHLLRLLTFVIFSGSHHSPFSLCLFGIGFLFFTSFFYVSSCCRFSLKSLSLLGVRFGCHSCIIDSHP
jgi:hypothetical protein